MSTPSGPEPSWVSKMEDRERRQKTLRYRAKAWAYEAGRRLKLVWHYYAIEITCAPLMVMILIAANRC